MKDPSLSSGGRRPLAVLMFAALAATTASACCVPGVSRYMQKSKEAEARNNLGQISRGLVACAEQPGSSKGGKKGLPPSSPPVPSALSAVSGKKYTSMASDWASPAWQCAKFSMSAPQYFQYRWELQSPTKGVVHADGDLNGDGAPDSSFELAVECSASGDCSVGKLVEK